MNETAEARDEKTESFSPSSPEFQLDEMTTSERSEPELESTVSQGKCHIVTLPSVTSESSFIIGVGADMLVAESLLNQYSAL